MSTYIISGGTGFIGRHLQTKLRQEGHTVYVLTTQKSKTSEYTKYWIPSQGYIDPDFRIEKGYIINLAGAGVADKRWSRARKQEILQSRIDSLRTIKNAILRGQFHCEHLCSASAIGYYGHYDSICTESTPPDNSFLSVTCRRWEQEALAIADLGVPTSIARIGIVLGKEGGALKELIKPLSFGIAAIPSDGKQIYSWISLEDISRLLQYLSENKMQGIFNAVAPNPCSVNELFKALTSHYKTLFSIHVPSIILKVLLGEMSIEVLKSTTVSCKKISDAGFMFRTNTIEEFMKSAL